MATDWSEVRSSSSSMRLTSTAAWPLDGSVHVAVSTMFYVTTVNAHCLMIPCGVSCCVAVCRAMCRVVLRACWAVVCSFLMLLAVGNTNTCAPSTPPRQNTHSHTHAQGIVETQGHTDCLTLAGAKDECRMCLVNDARSWAQEMQERGWGPCPRAASGTCNCARCACVLGGYEAAWL